MFHARYCKELNHTIISFTRISQYTVGVATSVKNWELFFSMIMSRSYSHFRSIKKLWWLHCITWLVHFEEKEAHQHLPTNFPKFLTRSNFNAKRATVGNKRGWMVVRLIDREPGKTKQWWGKCPKYFIQTILVVATCLCLLDFPNCSSVTANICFTWIYGNVSDLFFADTS